MSETRDEREERIERQKRIDRLNAWRSTTLGVILFYGYLVAILISAAFTGVVIFQNRRLAEQSHRALCSIKQEREARYDQANEILTHPEKPENAELIERFGRALIVRSRDTAKADKDALKDVTRC